VKIVDWPVQTWDAGIAAARRRSRHFDHVWTARERYNEVLGGRLAAAIAYYAFFAVFALGLLAYSIIGYVLASNEKAVEAVNKFLSANIPFLDAGQIADSRNTVAVIGLIGLFLTGAGWIESLRSSQRAVWGYDQQPGNLIIRRLVDMAILVGLGLLLALSVWIQTGINTGIVPFLFRLTPESVSVGAQTAIRTIGIVVGYLLALFVNCVLAVSMLSGVTRLRMPWRRWLPSTLLVAIGLSILSTVGRAYIEFSSHRPAYQVVGGTVALLLFLYLFNQVLLYGAALAATSRRGSVVDLAAGPPSAEDQQDQSGSTGTCALLVADDGGVGALVTLELAADSPILEMPWIITFGPLSDEEDWEPVVCGPYERPHAIALAEEIVADHELMAVVEPVLGFASVDEIRAEIAEAQAVAAASPALDDTFDEDDEDFDDLDLDEPGENGHHEGIPLPTPAEIRAGMARIAHRLAEPS
jgi:membrane protein